jgi:hypothetical protein
MMFHDGEMHRISRPKMPIPQYNLFRTLYIGLTNRKYLIDDSEQSVERGLDCIAAIDGDVPVQDLLKYLGIGNQALALADQLLQQLLRVAFVRMGWPDEVHRDI